MRYQGERIPEAETILERKTQLKMDNYKQSKEMEILHGLQSYEDENQDS
jgi:hypothetical protein